MLQPALRFGSTRNMRRRRSQEEVIPTVNANASADARQQTWNTAVAPLQQPILADANSDQPAAIALARALGYKEGETTPGIGALMARFQSLSPSVKAGIYKAGGAQFIAPEDASDMLSKQSDALDKVHDSHTNDIVNAITAGKIQYEKTPDGRINWFVNQEQDIDPNNPILGKKQIRVPANEVVKGYIDRAQTKGYIPDPLTGKFPETAAPQPSKQDIQRRMSSEDFQRVLDSRARGEIAPDALAPTIAANLATAKIPVPTEGTEMFGPAMPINRPNVGYIPSGQAAEDLSLTNNAAQNTAANLVAGGLNLGSRAINYVGEKADQVHNFLFGGDYQNPRIPLIKQDYGMEAQPNPADIAYFMAHRQKVADDSGGIGY